LQVVLQIDFGFDLGDGLMLQVAEMPIANRPVPCRANVRMGTAGIGPLRPVETFKALGQYDGRRWALRSQLLMPE